MTTTCFAVSRRQTYRQTRFPSVLCGLLALVWAAGTTPASIAQTDLPSLVLPEGVGVNIHFVTGHQEDLDKIAAGGFKFVRMDFAWSAIEREKGQYAWTGYDELTDNLEKRGLRAIYILDYSNGLYEETVSSRSPVSGQEVTTVAAPRTPESVSAFARWAAAAAEHFRGRRIVWEIWNEPNIHFWQPAPNVKDYTALALATCRAMRQADPEATIIAPASAAFPWPFLEEFFQAGILEYLDAVSVHPYRAYDRGPETAATDYQRLRVLIEQYAPPAKRSLPIISGEWGYATHTKGISPDVQAAFLARQQLANLYHGVPLSIWYDWKDDGPDPDEREHNFGTVRQNLDPKPAYRALQTMVGQLSGYRIARRIDTDQTEAWVLLCEDTSGQWKLAAWTTGDPVTLPLDLKDIPFQAVAAVDGFGKTIEAPLKEGRLVLALANLPQYVTLENSVPADINRAFEDANVQEFVGRFEREGREVFEKRAQVVQACQLRPGMAVADVGAGTGLYTRLFSPLVGPEGRVYAVDISPNFIEHIRRTSDQQGLKNVEAILCTEDSVQLPANSIDLAFICDTYHHFKFPHRTMESIHRALRPNGQVILIDFHRIEGVSSDWVLKHVRADQKTFTDEIESWGFRLLEEVKLLEESYFLRFQKVTANGAVADHDA